MPRAKPIGDLIDEMVDIRDRRREIAKEDSKLKGQYNELVDLVIEKMHATGTDQIRSDLATASLKVETVATVVDPARLALWVIKNKRVDLLQNRISNPVYREIMEGRRKREIPGLEGFEKETILLRTRN